MRIAQPFAFAARTTSATRSLDPMLPGLMRRQAAPASAASPVEEALAELQPDTLSPREALDALYRLQALLKSSTSDTPS